jgi:hypothetical protein
MCKKETKRKSLIMAIVHVSESEVHAVEPTYTYEWFDYTNPNYKKLLGILYDLGIDTNEYIELQAPVQHRNRMNEIVICGRFVGSEREDLAWIKSGYASREAIDKASGSKLLEELYRSKGLTIDAQLAMEYKDKYSKKGEE